MARLKELNKKQLKVIVRLEKAFKAAEKAGIEFVGEGGNLIAFRKGLYEEIEKKELGHPMTIGDIINHEDVVDVDTHSTIADSGAA